MNLILYLLFLLLTITSLKCSKILGIFPSPGFSHFILCEKLMTTLAARGHEVTVISAFEPQVDVKNYRTILIDGLVEKTSENLFLQEDDAILSKIVSFYEFGYVMTEYILSRKGVQELINSEETFDLVLMEKFGNEAHMGFHRHFNAPLILFSSIGLSEWNSHLIGNSRLPSVEPVSFSHYTNHMKFLQRLSNSALNLFDMLYQYFFVFPQHQKLVNKYFPNKISLKQIMYNASLLLLNSQPSITHPTTLTSSVIEIGGFHITPNALPSDIQKFLDESKQGALFFSMGSILNPSNLSNNTLSAILKVFSKLKQRVLWKYDDNNIPNKPTNVLISKWLPQSDILAHANTVAFITHGGLLSTTEAMLYGVPMVGIPIFGDQKMNVARSVEKGIAVHLPFKELSGENFNSVIEEVLNNPKYKENAKRYSNILRDQVVKPLDLAIYWIEYTIRHAGATHLKNSSSGLYWFQLYLVDVIGFVLLCIAMFCYLVKLLVQGLHKMFKTRNKLATMKITKKKVN